MKFDQDLEELAPKRWAENPSPAEDPGGVKVPYYQVFIAPRVLSNRLIGVCAILGACIFMGLFAIKEMLPLHRMMPYFVEADPDKGEVRKSNKVASEFTPNEANLRYFLNQWIGWSLTISRDSKTTLLPLAKEWTRDKASEELNELVFEREKIIDRLDRDRYLVREVRLATITFPFPGVAHATIPLVERPSNGEPLSYRKVMTIHFETLPVKSQEEQLKNPIGLTITHFTYDDEVVR